MHLAMPMEQHSSPYLALSKALCNIFGTKNTALIMKYLEQENAIQDGKVDVEQIEPALKSLFGQGAITIVNTVLLIVQKNSKALK